MKVTVAILLIGDVFAKLAYFVFFYVEVTIELSCDLGEPMLSEMYPSIRFLIPAVGLFFLYLGLGGHVWRREPAVLVGVSLIGMIPFSGAYRFFLVHHEPYLSLSDFLLHLLLFAASTAAGIWGGLLRERRRIAPARL